MSDDPTVWMTLRTIAGLHKVHMNLNIEGLGRNFVTDDQLGITANEPPAPVEEEKPAPPVTLRDVVRNESYIPFDVYDD